MVYTERRLKIFLKGKQVYQLTRHPEDFDPDDVSFIVEDAKIFEVHPSPPKIIKSYP